MPYFLADTPLAAGDVYTLKGNEARHALLSRRMKLGDIISLQGPDGKRYSCRITGLARNQLTVEAISQEIVPPEPRVSVTLMQGYISEQALDILLQKATELGASRITLFQAAHSPSAIKREKISRWERIVTEAAKQCGRGQWPSIEITSFASALSEEKPAQAQHIVLDACGREPLANVFNKKYSRISLWIGPEGGWSGAELNEFKKHNLTLARLPGYTLRAETAAIAALSIASAILHQ